MLNIGDYIPFFVLKDQDNVEREIQLYAGKKVAIFYMPADIGLLKSTLVMRKKYIKRINEKRIHTVVIVGSSRDTVKMCHDQCASTISFWTDEDGALGEVLGKANVNDSMLCLLTDENLKIADKFSSKNTMEIFNRILYVSDSKLARSAKKIAARHAPVIVVPNALNRKTCDRIIDYWKTEKQYRGSVGLGKNSRVNPRTKIRVDCNIVHDELLSELDACLGKSVFPELKKVGSFTVSHREKYKIGCYRAEENGHYEQHRDTSDISLTNRRYSLSVALNDGFEGGGLVFPEYSDDMYRVEKGDAIIFPSTLLHRVEPVTNGERFVMVSFLYGEEEAAFRSQYLKQKGDIDNTDDNRLLSIADFSRLCVSNVYTQTDKVYQRYSREKTKNTDFYVRKLPDSIADQKVIKSSVRAFSSGSSIEGKDLLDLAEKAIDELLFSKAEQYIDYYDSCFTKDHYSAADENQLFRRRIGDKLLSKRKRKENYLVLIAGDSLSLPRPWYLKEFDPEFNPFLATGYFDTYPQLLEDKLANKLNYKKVRVSTNLAQRSFKITNLTARLPDIFSYSDPDIVIVQVGVVDCWLRGERLDKQDVPIGQFRNELKKIVQYKERACPNKYLVFMGICPTDISLFKRNTGMNEVIAEYNSALEEVSMRSDRVVFFDTSALLDFHGTNQLLHLDGIHYSKRGHGIIAQELCELIAGIESKNIEMNKLELETLTR